MHCDPSHIMSGKKNGIPIYLNGIVFFNIINFHNLILKWLTLLIVLSTQLSRCPWLVAGRWFFPGTPVSPINKTDRHDITEILLKMSLNTITLTQLCRRLSYLSYKMFNPPNKPDLPSPLYPKLVYQSGKTLKLYSQFGVYQLFLHMSSCISSNDLICCFDIFDLHILVRVSFLQKYIVVISSKHLLSFS